MDIRLTTDLVDLAERLFVASSDDFNRTISDEPLMISVKRSINPSRLIVASALWALSVRSDAHCVECFVLPCAEQHSLIDAEAPSRCKLRLVIKDGGIYVDETPVDYAELKTLFGSLLNDVIVKSQREFDSLPDSVRLVFGGQSLTGSVRSLVAEKHVLVRKIVNQQENIQSQIARDLHDAVLGNMLVLERSFTGGRRLHDLEIVKILRETTSQLRDICHDLYPRDLRDCGLKAMLQELCERVTDRGTANCSLSFNAELPDLPDEVMLHTYRIAQECLNNIAQHSHAKVVQVQVYVDENTFELSISDDGCGFDPSIQAPMRAGRGGGGTSIIRERAELIDAMLPCHLYVDSRKERGTKVSLRITYRS